MATHRYRVGQSLNYSPSRMGHVQSDRTCKVIRLLPPDSGGVPQYRIQCASEAVERVATENLLSRKS